MTPTLVTEINRMGDDRFVAFNAWLSTGKHTQAYTCDEKEIKRIIRFLLRGSGPNQPHASPFGHPHLSVLVERAPIFVAHQWERHRAQNYSENSFRYTSIPEDADPDEWFYAPDEQDVRGQVGRPGAYTFASLLDSNPDGTRLGIELVRLHNQQSLSVYDQLINQHGWAPELARTVLPVGTLTDFTATASLRNWLNFLVLRDDEHAQLEIRQPAEDVRKIIATRFPITFEAWEEMGRPVV